MSMKTTNYYVSTTSLHAKNTGHICAYPLFSVLGKTQYVKFGIYGRPLLEYCFEAELDRSVW